MQNLTIEHNSLIYRLDGNVNYCETILAKSVATSNEVDRFNNECGDKDWSTAAYSHCNSWSSKLDTEMDERVSEHDKFMAVSDKWHKRADIFRENLEEFSEQLNQAECDEVKEEFSSYQRSYESTNRSIMEIQPIISIIRKKTNLI